MAHRTVLEAVRHLPPQPVELGLGLMTFVLASAGVLLIIHGAGLFGRDRERSGRSQEPARRDMWQLFTGPVTLAGPFYDTRFGASLMKARHTAKAPGRFDDPRLPGGVTVPEARHRRRSISPSR